MIRVIWCVAAGAALACCAIAAGNEPAKQDAVEKLGDKPVSFASDVKPILAAKCWNCHGPDAKTRKGDLRLDARKFADHVLLSDGDSVPDLLVRITADDLEIRMPPASSKKQLNKSEIETLTRWVKQGARYEQHWAFQPPQRPAIPDVHSAAIQNPIDNFVIARLEAESLAPSPEAERATLIRRLSLDVTGIPPTTEQVDAFLADTSNDAYEKLVDRLLESPRYGEHMAVPWLDAARYADTDGYQNDRYRYMHVWRDWVVLALNENLPYDQFLVEQIAGDMLPKATLKQQIATGFCRNHRINSEDGSIPEEWHVEEFGRGNHQRVTATAAVKPNDIDRNPMNPIHDYKNSVTRRHFFGQAGVGLAALSTLLHSELRAETATRRNSAGGLNDLPHFAPKARRVIYLVQSGGPSQIDLLDSKPNLKQRFGQEVPKSVYPDERKTTMSNAQSSFATAPSPFEFRRFGKSGLPMSELLSHTGEFADDLCIVNSMHTTAINHDPAITLLLTGSQTPGRPSAGSWLSYGLGTESSDLPAFVAMSSKGSAKAGQPLYDRLWGSGFLPSVYQGVKFRNQGVPVLDIYDPAGVDRETRRTMLDYLAKLNELKFQQSGDPEIQTRIAQYEMAGQMQASVPQLLDISQESANTLASYGPDVKQQGTYAYNCLIARRLAERGVRFIQLDLCFPSKGETFD
jgi:hypothetical protein